MFIKTIWLNIMKKIRLTILTVLLSTTAISAYAVSCKNGVPDGQLPPNCKCVGDRISCTFP